MRMPRQIERLMSSESAGRSRILIEGVQPEIDAGRFPIRRPVGERVVVEADVFGDGHDEIAVVLCYRADETLAGNLSVPAAPLDGWHEGALTPLVNDRWQAEFTVDRVGTFCYTIVAWVDRFATWHHELQKRLAADQVTAVDLAIGAELIAAAAERAEGDA